MVTKAEFKLKGAAFDPEKRQRLDSARTKVAKAAAEQALSWGEADDAGLAKDTALKIVVLRHLFAPADFDTDPRFGDDLEAEVRTRPVTVCDAHAHVGRHTPTSTPGVHARTQARARARTHTHTYSRALTRARIPTLAFQLISEFRNKVAEPEKLTLFSRHPDGIVVVKFRTAFAAEDCIKARVQWQ